ncbi:MAG: hypothetical protein R3D00_16950 [Bacteroidia bacterium]
MKQTFTLLALLFFVSTGVQAQKVALCGFNTDNNDGFAFVALIDLVEGDVIYFTDGTYVASSNSFNVSSTNNTVITYTVPAGGIPKGQVIRAEETSSNTLTATRSGGATPTGSFSISAGSNFRLSGGEPLFAFRATMQRTLPDL